MSYTYTVDSLPKSKSFELIPNGTYSARITKSEPRTTKAGGEMLGLSLTITGPSNQGRIVFSNINLKCENPTAEKIGNEQLHGLMVATGKTSLTRETAEQFVNCEVMIRISTRPASGDYEAANTVQAFTAPKSAGVPMADSVQASRPAWAQK